MSASPLFRPGCVHLHVPTQKSRNAGRLLPATPDRRVRPPASPRLEAAATQRPARPGPNARTRFNPPYDRSPYAETQSRRAVRLYFLIRFELLMKKLKPLSVARAP